MAKKGLGKGLNSLFNEEDIEEVTSEITKSSEGDIKKVRMSLIEPNKKQPRRHFDEEKITALADSIKEHGLIQPIIIIALIENLQRENLNPIEEAIGYNLLMDEFNLTQELISQRVGKSRSAIANSLRLLSLEDEIQKMLILGTLTSGHARAILSLDDKELRIALSKHIIEDNLNVRQAEALAKQLQKKKPQKKKSEKTAYDIEIEKIQNQLSSAMGTKVRINHTAKKGKIEIEYYGNEDLERVLGFFNIKGE